MLEIAIVVIIIGIVGVLIRLIRGKTVWDKLLSFNLMAIQVAMLIMTYAVYTEVHLVADIAIAYSVIGFLSLILITRFISMGGKE